MSTNGAKDKVKMVNIDEMLEIVGEYGRFQRLINVVLCIFTLPSFYHVMLAFFAAHDPDWKCKSNTTCYQNYGNRTFESNENQRCSYERSEWTYVEPKSYSLVTYFDLSCDQQWLSEFVSSIFFIGWVLGSFVLGIVCDTYGRKIVLNVSMTAVICIGFISALMPKISLFIVCRFIIGFFLPGTNVQIFMIVTEIVGNKYKGFAGLSTFACGVFSLTMLGVKAYYIQNWKTLYIVCTAPYIFVAAFFKFIPESVRFLRVKGKNVELMECFRRIAYWNQTTIPENTAIMPVPVQTEVHKANPLHLFKNMKLAIKTGIQIFAMFATGISYYGLYMAAGDLGGSMYRNYIMISASEIPLIFFSVYLCERFGRKKTSTIPMLIGCAACVSVAFIPNKGGLKIVRVIIGMIGKCCVGSNMNTMSTWSSELYPTVIRGEALGFFQAALRTGASAAPWLDKELVKVHKSAAFLFMAAICAVSFTFLNFLPETKGVVTNDDDEEPEEKIDSLNVKIQGITNEMYTQKLENEGPDDVDVEMGNMASDMNVYVNPGSDVKE